MELLSVVGPDVRSVSSEFGQHSTLEMDFGELRVMGCEVFL